MYSYIARDAAGQRVTGQVTAATAQAVLVELESRQLAPVRVQEVHESLRYRSMRHRIGVRLLANAYRQLADLLRAGVPLLRALKLLGRSKSNPRLAKVMSNIASAVADGSRLADAMAAHGEVFPPVQVAMVRAGERGGFLEQVLTRMGSFLEQEADLRAKVIGNLIYPVVLLGFLVVLITVALVAIVPQFRGFYARIELPWPTKALLAASDLTTKYWLITLISIVLASLLGWHLWRQPGVRRALTILQMRIPRVGSFLSNLAVARFARILGTLLGNGIPMLSAMQIARDAAGNVLLAEAIDSAVDAVRAGDSLAEPLSMSGLFAEDVVEMIRVGESANNLHEVLITIADTIDRRVERILSVLVRLMEPALLLVMGSAVFFMALALIIPMIRMSTSLSGR
jgi:general secretion pathway protein F